MTVTVNIRGLEETRRIFKKAVKKLDKKELKKAAMKGADPVLKDAINNIPKRSGDLKKNIKKTVLRSSKSGITIGIGPDKDKGWYAHFVHFGTISHEVEPRKDKKALYGPLLEHPIPRAKHPGGRSNPFLLKAFDDNKIKIDYNVRIALQTALKMVTGKI